jgi:hypothetical protein
LQQRAAHAREAKSSAVALRGGSSRSAVIALFRSSPMWTDLGRLGAVEYCSTMQNDADRRMLFPLVSVVSRALNPGCLGLPENLVDLSDRQLGRVVPLVDLLCAFKECLGVDGLAQVAQHGAEFVQVGGDGGVVGSVGGLVDGQGAL